MKGLMELLVPIAIALMTVALGAITFTNLPR